MNKTLIPWADKVWNPITGCTPVSEGCQNCYAARMAPRLRGRCGYDLDNPFRLTLHHDKMQVPFKDRIGCFVFVCSMGDLFHDDIPETWQIEVLQVMRRTPQHTYLVLTKRPARMLAFLSSYPVPTNVWLGVTAENQARFEERVQILQECPASVRFVSIEPMLGPIYGAGRRGIGWIIAGPETGPSARPCSPVWINTVRESCEVQSIPFFDKRETLHAVRQRPSRG